MDQQTTTEPMVPGYLEPRALYAPIEVLLKDPAERRLADQAVDFFLQNPAWNDKDRLRCKAMYGRMGMGMFIWKYYAAARLYLGGYKALAAHLQLRRVR